ncbi:hypothetical protein [Roseibium aggregatum]|uniref:ZP domain-containing protein n=1 Tax=Roseibium aggregatum TaxID=187304 RepID=A0A939EC30_9HYPH|nr:hypothetical protein [Roseibium aggregatum]MBN9669145.1 hypothetical protein [Roseibium aggregatum]
MLKILIFLVLLFAAMVKSQNIHAADLRDCVQEDVSIEFVEYYVNANNRFCMRTHTSMIDENEVTIPSKQGTIRIFCPAGIQTPEGYVFPGEIIFHAFEANNIDEHSRGIDLNFDSCKVYPGSH